MSPSEILRALHVDCLRASLSGQPIPATLLNDFAQRIGAIVPLVARQERAMDDIVASACEQSLAAATAPNVVRMRRVAR